MLVLDYYENKYKHRISKYVQHYQLQDINNKLANNDINVPQDKNINLKLKIF